MFPSDPLDSSVAVNQDVVTIMKSLTDLYSNVKGFDEHVYTCILNGERVEGAMEQVLHAITTGSVSTSFTMIIYAVL